MEFDDYKVLWADSSRALAASTQLNALLVRQSNVSTTGRHLKRAVAGAVFAMLGGVVTIVATASFAADNVARPEFFVPALAIWLYLLGLTIAEGVHVAGIARLDFDEPVVATALRLENLRLWRIRTILAALLFGPLMWVPFAIVALRGFFGVDLYAIAPPAWFVANVALGLATIPLGVWLARTFSAVFAGSPALRAIGDAIAGRSLRDALDSLDTIRRFEEE